jgi:hypothetical protein
MYQPALISVRVFCFQIQSAVQLCYISVMKVSNEKVDKNCAQSTSREHSHNLLQENTRTIYFKRTLAQCTSTEHSHNLLQQNTRTIYFNRTLAQSTSTEHSHNLLVLGTS